MPLRAIRILDTAPLSRKGVLVLELDAPSPLLGVAIGMPIDLVFKDASRERLELKGLGFASSTPDHAHIIVTMPKRTDLSGADRIEVETRGG